MVFEFPRFKKELAGVGGPSLGFEFQVQMVRGSCRGTLWGLNPQFGGLDVPREFTVLGPQLKIIALVGRDVTFPCHLSPQMDAQHMNVMWFHDQLGVVHQYKYEKDYLIYQHLKYQGRTEFLHENISRGNVALRLHHVQPSDEGKYRCYFASPTYNDEAEFQMDVASTGSSPHLHSEDAGNKRIRLVCTSAGWYPEPEVQWRNHMEEPLSQGTTINKKENGLFSVETSITVSANSKENVSCVIGNPRLSQKLEASFSLSDALFPDDIHQMEIWIWIIIFLSIGFLVIIIIIIIKRRKSKNNEVATMHEDSPNRFFLLKKNDKRAISYSEEPMCEWDMDILTYELGEERFDSGKYCWEVNVEGKTEWALGLCKDSVCNEEEADVTPETGFWIVCLVNSDTYQALSSPWMRLHVAVPPKTVKIFLDYETGTISFYNATESTYIHTFQDTFKEALRPCICPGSFIRADNNFSKPSKHVYNRKTMFETTTR
ncbi:butyrophilin subfamily 1 member A1-like [Gracilinanus agilis]|uniref:butyrophilin subfamily 1 member A1-like n=1 Tax=Gracilinanus agilis TaxID=191870 RepID=UPI001CFD8881|nr:butyrophilin subfamily 1 member A1-like [Gracilinanus agilis]